MSSTLNDYRKFTTSTWGFLVNIVIFVSPANLALELGFGKSFIPVYGNSILATGLATFLSIFVVFAMFTARQGISELHELDPILFWLIFASAFSAGVVLLATYTWLQPVYDLGAFLYAAAFVAFTAAFHLLAIQEFMGTHGPTEKKEEERDVLSRGKYAIANVIDTPLEALVFVLASEDDVSWTYIVTDTLDVVGHVGGLSYRAIIDRKSGEVRKIEVVKPEQ